MSQIPGNGVAVGAELGSKLVGGLAAFVLLDELGSFRLD
jgi:hypothetical protein